MDDKLETLLQSLNDEIDQKCNEIQMKKQEERNTSLFLWICTLFICLPIVFLFAGINIVAVVFPAICFFAISIFILSPIIIEEDMGGAIQ